MMKRMISALLIVAILCSLVPIVATQQVQAATVSTSTAPSTTAAEVAELFAARSEGQHPENFGR